MWLALQSGPSAKHEAEPSKPGVSWAELLVFLSGCVYFGVSMLACCNNTSNAGKVSHLRLEEKLGLMHIVHSAYSHYNLPFPTLHLIGNYSPT